MSDISYTASIEHATQRARCTAKMLTAATRKASRVFFHGERVYGQPSYCDAFTFRVTCQQGERRDGIEPLAMVLDVPGEVTGGHTDATEESAGGYLHARDAFRPASGFWSLHAAEDCLRDALASLPPDAEVWLKVCLDHGSNEYLMRAKLHSDVLMLCARWTRGGKQHGRAFIVDTTVCAHNTARFGGPH